MLERISMTSWFTSLPVQVQAALIGALASIAVGILRDFASKWWSEKREAKKNAEDIYRRYAEPLSTATTSLLWRLKEIFSDDRRGSYLTAKAPRSTFEDYKLISTYYRLAATLGWLRALRRELSFLRLESNERLTALEEAISGFESTLADGHHVELQRLDGLLTTWGLGRITDNQTRLRVAVAVESCVKRLIQHSQVGSATELEEPTQIDLCREIAHIVCSQGGLAAVSPLILAETKARSLRQIDIREAWLYRDWQGAIGDLMIRDETSGNRRFGLLGFGEFESMLLNPTEEQSRSLSRIKELFDQVNVYDHDPFDARPEALRRLYKATAGMVKAMAEVRIGESVIDAKAATEARQVLQDSVLNPLN